MLIGNHFIDFVDKSFGVSLVQPATSEGKAEDFHDDRADVFVVGDLKEVMEFVVRPTQEGDEVGTVGV